MNWNYPQITNFHDRVRALLDTQIISDEQMDIFEKAPSSERYIKSIITNWQEIKNKADNPTLIEEGDTRDYKTLFAIFESCIVYHTSMQLEGYVKKRDIKTKVMPSMTVTYDTSNTNENKGLSLKERLDMLLEELLSEFATEEGAGFYFGFRVT